MGFAHIEKLSWWNLQKGGVSIYLERGSNSWKCYASQRFRRVCCRPLRTQPRLDRWMKYGCSSTPKLIRPGWFRVKAGVPWSCVSQWKHTLSFRGNFQRLVWAAGPERQAVRRLICPPDRGVRWPSPESCWSCRQAFLQLQSHAVTGGLSFGHCHTQSLGRLHFHTPHQNSTLRTFNKPTHSRPTIKIR